MNAANEMFRAGREHHKSWFQVLRHPDLDLLALIDAALAKAGE